MKKLSEAIRAGRLIHPAIGNEDRILWEHCKHFGESDEPLESEMRLRSNLLGAALVGTLGAAAALRLTMRQAGESYEDGEAQINLILADLFPLLSVEAFNPFLRKAGTVKDVLDVAWVLWTEPQTINWLESLESGTRQHSIGSCRFIDTVAADGCLNRIYAGGEVMLRARVADENPEILIVRELNKDNSLIVQPVIRPSASYDLAAELVVNCTPLARTRLSLMPAARVAELEEAVKSGSYLPLDVNGEMYYDIESAIAAAHGSGGLILNGFGFPASEPNRRVESLPAVAGREIIHTTFFEVSGEYFPGTGSDSAPDKFNGVLPRLDYFPAAQNAVLPNRNDFGTDETFKAAVRVSYEKSYPGSDAERFSFAVALCDGYGYRDEAGLWQVFDSRTEAFDSLTDDSTITELRRKLAGGENPNLLVQNADISPLKSGDRWYWTVDRFRGEVFDDGLEVSVALNTSSKHRLDLVLG